MPNLRDLTISAYDEYHDRKAFNLSTNCVSSFYLDTLGKYSTEKLQKIIVTLTPQNIQHIDKMDNVCRVYHEYNFEEHLKGNIITRKKSLLEALHQGIIQVCVEYGMEQEPFNKVFGILVDSDLKFIRPWKTSTSSPDRKRMAQVFYRYDMDKVTICARIWEKTKKEQCHEIELVTTEPHEYKFVPLLGKLSWVDNNKLKLEPKQKKMEPIVFTP